MSVKSALKAKVKEIAKLAIGFPSCWQAHKAGKCLNPCHYCNR